MRNRALACPIAPVERLGATREIRSGAEAAPLPGDDHGADGIVGIGALECLDQLTAHARRERVQTVWSRQADREDMVIDRVADLLELRGRRRLRGSRLLLHLLSSKSGLGILGAASAAPGAAGTPSVLSGVHTFASRELVLHARRGLRSRGD